MEFGRRGRGEALGAITPLITLRFEMKPPEAKA